MANARLVKQKAKELTLVHTIDLLCLYMSYHQPEESCIPLLEEHELIKRDHSSNEFVVTERGKVYIEAIKKLPLPQCHWLMPD